MRQTAIYSSVVTLLVSACSLLSLTDASAQPSLESLIVDEVPGGFVPDASGEAADGVWVKTFLLNGKTLQIRAQDFGSETNAMGGTAVLATGFGSELDNPVLTTHSTEVGVLVVDGRSSGNRFLAAFYADGSIGYFLSYPAFAPDDPMVFDSALIAQLTHSGGERGEFSATLLDRVRADIGVAPTLETDATEDNETRSDEPATTSSDQVLQATATTVAAVDVGPENDEGGQVAATVDVSEDTAYENGFGAGQTLVTVVIVAFVAVAAIVMLRGRAA